MEQGLVSPEIVRGMQARHAEYSAGKVPEDVMCGEMVTMHRGLREVDVQRACDKYYALAVEQGVFPEMRELARRLREAGCDVWAVSSSNQWIIQSAMKTFGIPSDHVLAAQVAVQDGVITDRLIRVPSGHGKVEAIEVSVKRQPDCAFGNAIWDREMLALARHGFAINPNPNLKEIALAKGWTVYQPE
jgi:phosphoserine phosphatase